MGKRSLEKRALSRVEKSLVHSRRFVEEEAVGSSSPPAIYSRLIHATRRAGLFSSRGEAVSKGQSLAVAAERR